MNISIIFTGGTIGSLTKKEWVGIDEATNYMLLSEFEKKKTDVRFETSAPYSVLSENLSANELNLLQNEIARVSAKKPDGIIVTHGTDTIQYASTAIEYAFADTDIPIVFVSADYPLDNEQTNGHINFEAAVEFIKSKAAKGVFVSYKNNNKDFVNIHIASRVLQHGENSANLYSIGNSVFAEYKNGNIELKGVDLAEKTSPLGQIEYTERSGILSVESVPANSYCYSLDNVKAVILKPFHSATLNTESKELADFCKKANEKNIPVFVSNVKKGIGYESTKLFDELNIRPAPYGTYVALYMKLWAAISAGYDLVSFIEKTISNECAE